VKRCLYIVVLTLAAAVALSLAACDFGAADGAELGVVRIGVGRAVTPTSGSTDWPSILVDMFTHDVFLYNSSGQVQQQFTGITTTNGTMKFEVPPGSYEFYVEAYNINDPNRDDGVIAVGFFREDTIVAGDNGTVSIPMQSFFDLSVTIGETVNGNDVTLTANITRDPDDLRKYVPLDYTYKWYKDNDSSTSVGTGATYTPSQTAAGTYEVEVHARGYRHVGNTSPAHTFTPPTIIRIPTNVAWYDSGGILVHLATTGANPTIESGTSGNPKSYIINIESDITADGSTLSTTFGAATDIVVTINGGGHNITLNNTDPTNIHGSLLRIGMDQTVTINNLNLVGMASNSASLVIIDGNNASLTMIDGAIRGNVTDTASVIGGGVQVINGGEFNMTSGTISGNTAGGSGTNGNKGGGVYVGGSGTFNMNGGAISGNTAGSTNDGKGGGVYVENGTFRITNGTINGSAGSPPNTATGGAGSGAALFVDTDAGGAAFYGDGQGGPWSNLVFGTTYIDTTIVVQNGNRTQ